MNFNCDNCKARYFIPDERVAGRRVTITCKRCSHKIHIRDGAVASQSGQVGAKQLPNKPAIAVAPPPVATPRARREKPVWMVAINEVPVGPLPIAEIARKAKLGAVTLDSLCWREGLEEWVPASEIDEIREAIERASAPPPEESESESEASAIGAQAAPPPVARSSRPSLADVPAVKPKASSKKASSKKAEAELPEAWASKPAPSVSVSEDELQEDASARISLPSARSPGAVEAPDADTNEEEGAAGAPSDVEAEAGASAAGAIGSLESASDEPSRTSLSVREVDRDPTPRASLVSTMPEPASAQRSLLWRFALVGLLTGVLGYLIGFWHGAQNEAIATAPEGAESEEASTRESATASARRPLSAQLRFDDSLAVDEPQEANSEKDEGSAASSGSATAMSSSSSKTTSTPRLRPPSTTSTTTTGSTASTTTSEMRALTAEERRMLESFGNTGSAPKIGGASAPTSTVRSTQAGSAPARATGGLDSASISRVISQNQPSLQQCYERAVRGMPIAQSLRINVHIVIGGSGTVTRAQASGDSLPGLNTCIENAVKRWQFPSAPGGGETRFPVVFSGK